MRIGGNYGIHGTNAPNSIGHYASHGCVRMHEKDVEDLFSHVKMHTPVDIVYDRVVIQRDDDHTISYYVYPDGYKRQSLDTAYVKKVLHGYGVDTFADESLLPKKSENPMGSRHMSGKCMILSLMVRNWIRELSAKMGLPISLWIPSLPLFAWKLTLNQKKCFCRVHMDRLRQ